MGIYDTSASLHAIAGTVALCAFWASALLRKGSAAHVLAGRVYLGAMVALMLLALPLVAIQLQRGTGFGGFLAYLLVITATACWTSWRSLRLKRDFARYAGTPLRAVGWLNLGAGVAMLVQGMLVGSVLFIGFSIIGVLAGRDLITLHRRGPADARWWLREHVDGMTGNAVATHIAFLAIGLPRWLPDLSGPLLQNLAWFGPLAVAFAVRALLRRRWDTVARRAEVAMGERIRAERAAAVVRAAVD